MPSLCALAVGKKGMRKPYTTADNGVNRLGMKFWFLPAMDRPPSLTYEDSECMRLSVENIFKISHWRSVNLQLDLGSQLSDSLNKQEAPPPASIRLEMALLLNCPGCPQFFKFVRMSFLRPV